MLQETTYSQFDEPLAGIYNKFWGPGYNKIVLPTLEKLQLHIPDGANVLDLCCGSGQLSQWLLSKGYQVTGVDRSERMLQYAREKAPDCKLILGDVRFLELLPSLHAVFSTGLGFNHILNFDELTSTFHNAYKALNTNGIFVFDLRLKDGYDRPSWNGTMDGDLKEEYAWARKKVYDSESQECRVYMTIFYLIERDLWKRLETTWLMRGYSKSEVISALEKVGFTEISIYDFEVDLEVAGMPHTVYFVCRKSS